MAKRIVPDFQYFMKPVLEYVDGVEEATTHELLIKAVERANLSDDQLLESLPSGRSVANDRAHWAKTYLTKAGLLESPHRGVFKITDRGREALKSGGAINVGYLQQFPEFVEFKSRTYRETPESQSITASASDQDTPEELMAKGHKQLENVLIDDLKQKLHENSPIFFEHAVLDLLVAMGYGGNKQEAAIALGRSGDGGVDGVIKEDPLGLDVIYVQAKRWGGTVGRPTVREFAGALHGFKATKGVLITTSVFSQEAQAFAKSIPTRIILIDGERLARLMIANNVGVTGEATYTIKRVDEDYFDETV